MSRFPALRAVSAARAALASCAVAALASCAPPAREADRPAVAADTAGVRAVLAAQLAAWNRGDLEGFLDGYWRSDSLTFYSGGDVARGWRAARDRYVRRYASGGAEMGRLAFDVHAVEPLGPDRALVKGAWSLALGGASPRGLFTLVFARTPAGWRIVHDHSSLGE